MNEMWNNFLGVELVKFKPTSMVHKLSPLYHSFSELIILLTILVKKNLRTVT